MEYLDNTVKEYPDKIAYIDENRAITFSELRANALKLATEIIVVCNGMRNRPIVVFMEKSVECIEAFMGVVYSGNFYVPIDIKSPRERIDKIINVLKPSAVISKDSSYDLTGNWEKISYNNIIAKNEIDEKEIYQQRKKVLDVDPLYVLFTSGSTGTPKGVTISHRGVIDYIEWLREKFAFDSTTVFGNQAPFYFDNSILDIYSTMRNAAAMVIIPDKLFAFPQKLFDFINEKKINAIFWVPSALIGVANSGILTKVKLNNICKILFCGEVMPNKHLNLWRSAYPNALYANLYGPTEITDVCTYYIVDRKFEDDEPLPIGKACENTEILVINDDLKLVENGEIGELCVRGTCLSMGYYGDKNKTKEVFIQNPLNDKYTDYIYCTGDLVKYNEYGELVYVCRKDFQIKHQGHRIELGEIETAVLSIKKIKQGCAIYDSNNKKIVLFCTINEEINEKSIYQLLKGKLPRYMLPSLIFIIDEMPLNLNGKIDRILLKKIMERKIANGE